MTKTAEEYGRRPVPADKWVRSTLENALFDARESLATVEIEKVRTHTAAAKADEMHLLWLSRISHLEAAMAALDAIPESPPVLRPWAPKLGDGLVCTTPDGHTVELLGTAGMPQSFSMSMTGSAGLPAGSQSEPLSPPLYCDECERPAGPGHFCRGRRPKKLLRDRTTGEDSQEL